MPWNFHQKSVHITLFTNRKINLKQIYWCPTGTANLFISLYLTRLIPQISFVMGAWRQPNMQVCRLGKPRVIGENMQSQHRKNAGLNHRVNSEPSCNEAGTSSNHYLPKKSHKNNQNHYNIINKPGSSRTLLHQSQLSSFKMLKRSRSSRSSWCILLVLEVSIIKVCIICFLQTPIVRRAHWQTNRFLCLKTLKRKSFHQSSFNRAGRKSTSPSSP